MATVEVTPIAHRAKWAQQRTQYDETDAPAPVVEQPRPAPTRAVIVVEYTSQRDLDAVLNHAERTMRVLWVW